MVKNTLIILGITFGLIVAALVLLSISWLFKGKSSLRPGACGRLPGDCSPDEKSTNCQLCEHKGNTEEKQIDEKSQGEP